MGMIGNTLAQGLISGANIVDGTVDTPDIKDSAVTTAKIANGVVTPGKLSTGAPTWDSASTLLVNTTAAPSYGTGYGIVQFGGGSTYSNTSSTFIGSNYFYNSGGSDARLSTNAVGIFALRTPASGNTYFEWFGSSNGGTAGGTVALTNYAVLNQTGLAVRSAGSTSDLGGNTPLAIGNASSGYSTYALLRAATGSSYDSAVQFINGTTSVYCGQMQGSGGGAGNFNVHTNGAIRMTVDTIGRLGIGTTGPGYTIHTSKPSGNQTMRLETGGAGDYSYISLGAGSMGWQMGIGGGSTSTNTNSFYMYDERTGKYIAATDSVGNFYIGNTGGASYATAMAGTSPGLQLYSQYAPVVQNGSGNCWLHYVAAGGTYIMYDVTAGSDQLTLTKSTGNLAIRGAYGYISDRKLKENIVDATPKLADLMRLRIRSFNMIGDSRKMLGLIAQEVEEVFPALIEEKPDVEMGTPENGGEIIDLGTTTKSIKASVLVPMLIKAVQEQQAIIEALTERITALEAA